MGPVLSIRKVLFVRNTDLLFEEDLHIYCAIVLPIVYKNGEKQQEAHYSSVHMNY